MATANKLNFLLHGDRKLANKVQYAGDPDPVTVFVGGKPRFYLGWSPDNVSSLVQWLEGGVSGPWMLDSANTGDDRILNNGPGLQRGRGVSVNGHNQHLEVSDDAAFDFSGTNAFSLTVLMNSTGSSGWDYILSKRGSNGGFFLALHHSEVKFGFGDGSSNYTVATGHTFVHGADTVLTVTYDGDKGRLYIDGTLVFTSASLGAATLATNTEDLYIGQDNFGGGFLTALVAGIHIHNTDVGQSGASWLAFQGGSKPAGLVGRWLLDEQSGSTHYDSSGNGNNATAYNSPTHSTQNLKSWQNDEGYSKSGAVYIPRDESNTSNDVLGNPLDFSGSAPLHAQLLSPAGTFDGVDDYLDYGDVGAVGNVTVSAWVYFDTVLTNGIVSKFQNAAGGKSFFLYTAGGKLKWLVSTDGTAEVFINSGSTLNTGQWYHIVATYDGTTMKTYVDGVLDDSGTGASGSIHTTTSKLIVSGYDNTAHDFHGQIADIRVMDRAITAGEVMDLFHGVPPSSDDDIIHSPVCEKTGTTIHDVSGNGNHATLYNATLTSFWANTQTKVAWGCNNGYRLDGSTLIPAQVGGLVAADGNAITNPPGFNGASELDHDPYTVPKLDSGNLDGVTPPSAHALGDSVVDAAQHFIRQTATKEDRFLLFSEDLVEPNLSKANSYTA